MALTKSHNRMIEGSVVNVLDYIPQSEHAAIKAGTSTYDASSDIQTAIDARLGPVYVPPGTYVCESPIQIRHNTVLYGGGGYDHPDSNDSKLLGKHTGAGILVAQRTLQAQVSDLILEGDQTTTPKTGFTHGRSSSASSGSSRYTKIIVSGYFSKAGIYTIASEGNVIEDCTVTILGGGALYGFYTNQADTLSVNSYTASSNIVGSMRNCFFQFPNNTSGGIAIFMDAGDVTTEWLFENNYAAIPSNGYFAKFVSSTSASATRGPITFINNGVEPISGATPSGLFYFETGSVKNFYGFTLINNRLTYNANAISTNNKVVLNNLYYLAPNTSDIVNMSEDIQTYGLTKSWVKANGTVTVDSSANNTRNTIVETGITSFVNAAGGATARFETGASKYLEITSDAANAYPEIETSVDRFFLRTTANSGSGAVIEALSGGDQALRPEVDNTYKLGRASFRWSEVFAGTGTINTSDENLKENIRDISDTEKAVATAIKSQMKAFQFSDAVAAKGSNARIHFGVIAQNVRDAFVAGGLDPTDYGVFCSDTWTDDDGNQQTRLGIRYDELFAFIISTL